MQPQWLILPPRTHPICPFPSAPDSLVHPCLVGLFRELSPGVPMEELRSLTIFLYFGEMITLCKLASTCHDFRGVSKIWCQGCWDYTISSRREMDFKHSPASRYGLLELSLFRQNWYCWCCWNDWIHPNERGIFKYCDFFDATDEEEESFFQDHIATHPEDAAEWLLVRHSGGFLHWSVRDQMQHLWSYQHMACRKKYFP